MADNPLALKVDRRLLQRREKPGVEPNFVAQDEEAVGTERK